ncbi:MAG: hypothetical protein AB8G22_03720 [Saprospiraceae bacterium]
MDKFFRFFIFSLVLSMFACAGETSNPANNNTSTSQTDAETSPSVAKTSPTTHDCTVSGKVLEGNQIWLRDQNTLVAIAADSTTYDDELGDSHRTLMVYNTANCELIKRLELPVNISPDYAYYLAKVNYNNVSKLVGITAFNSVYLYDTEAQQLLPPVQPNYLSKRNLDDANSGMIQHLELWEDYMVGYAQDGGSFVIDVSDKTKPTPTPAFAEYRMEDGSFSSLFLLPSLGEEQQVIVPKYDYEEGVFAVNPLFEQPVNLNTQISKGAQNNRFIILRENDVTKPAVVIDLVNREQVKLPADISKQNAKKILEWVRGNS